MSANIVAVVTTTGKITASNVLTSNVFQFSGPEVLTSSGAMNPYKLTVVSPPSSGTYNMTLTNPPQGTIIIKKNIIPVRDFSMTVSENSNTWSIPASNTVVLSWVLDRWILATIPFISVVAGLYTFTTATFNTGAATGRYGPTISQARSGLTGTPTPSNWYNTYLDMTTQGYQLWTVPETGTYTIMAAGGAGWYPSGGGYGAILTGTFSLTRGEVLTILVGQAGAGQGGGGGGTFVVRSPYGIGNCLIVAGGGGGKWDNSGGSGASAGQNSTSGVCAGDCGNVSGGGGTNGGGGGGGTGGGGSGGGGFLGNGGTGYAGYYCCGGGAGGNAGNGTSGNCGPYAYSDSIGRSYTNGAIGGPRYDTGGTSYSAGGFGGGAGLVQWNLPGGGGGGYSGGGGGGTNTGGCTGGVHEGGGGGGSINNGTNQSFSSTNSGPGYVTITKL